MLSSHDGVSVAALAADAIQLFYDDLGEGYLGYTRVLEPAPRLVVVNSLLRGDPREDGVIARLMAMQPPPPQSLAEELSPPPMVLHGRVRPPLLKRIVIAVRKM